MNLFKVVSPFEPSGDQGKAIDVLAKGLNEGLSFQTLKGVTGSGKTYSMAKIIEKVQRPTLVVSHNKTLAAQLYREFKDFFPDNAVEYFVSYYDYYQPEAYVPSKDLFIEKDASINDEIDRLKLSTTRSLMERKDVIVVSTVSCIYGVGSPASYKDMRIQIEVGQEINVDVIMRQLISLQYSRNDAVIERGRFRKRGDTIEIFPAYFKDIAYRISLDWDTVESICRINPVTGAVVENVYMCTVYPAKHFVLPEERIRSCVSDIREEMEQQLEHFESVGKLVEAQRLKSRTEYDM